MKPPNKLIVINKRKKMKKWRSNRAGKYSKRYKPRVVLTQMNKKRMIAPKAKVLKL